MCLPVDEIEKQAVLPMKGPVHLEEWSDFVCGLGNQLVYIFTLMATSLC